MLREAGFEKLGLKLTTRQQSFDGRGHRRRLPEVLHVTQVFGHQLQGTGASPDVVANADHLLVAVSIAIEAGTSVVHQ